MIFQAYLRIRPPPNGVSAAANYITVVNENEVLMTPPADHRLAHSNTSSSLFSGPLLRASALQLDPASHPTQPDDAAPTPTSSASPFQLGTLFKFTSVFSPNDTHDAAEANSQSAFFRSTTLPLVHDFLSKGENCLLFAYGPTGSGKTWTVQGGEGARDCGILPRVMDVVWRSLETNGAAANESAPAVGKKASKGPMMSTPNAKTPAGHGLGVKGDALNDILKASSEGQGGDLPDGEWLWRVILVLRRFADIHAVVPVDDSFSYSIWVSCECCACPMP